MTTDSFRQRATALEDEFFHRVDQQLIIRLREQYEEEKLEKSLQQATGIEDRRVLEELRSAEITPSTLVAFSLFPAAYVAWADGHVESAERKALLKAAHNLGVFENSPAYKVLESWLERRPPSELVFAWKDFIHAVRSTISEGAFYELREASMGRAEGIAKAAGGFLGIAKMSQAEKSALAELQEVFTHAAKSAEPGE